MEKTNVMRLLSQNNIDFLSHQYERSITDGKMVAAALNEDPERVFKTLVTIANDGTHHIFVIPVGCSLDLKKAAAAASVKSITMIPQKELLPLTGYIHGGCSPIGMKKLFPTYIEESAMMYEKIIFSAGKVGYQVEMAPDTLISFIDAKYADLI